MRISDWSSDVCSSDLWLIDGATPIQDVGRVLGIEEHLHGDEYETLAGFLMDALRRVPRRTDVVALGGYQFEVLDVDTYRVDQVLVTRLASARSEEHTSELQSLMRISYAVFCLKKKNTTK